MEGRINTAKTLRNSYFDGDNYDLSFSSQSPIAVHPWVSDRYDYAVTEDPELLMERNATAEAIYQIFQNSIYNDGRYNIVQVNTQGEKEMTPVIKIPKDDIKEVFNYVKTELQKVKELNAAELLMAINEFFDFSYDFVYKKVLTPQMKQEVLEDLYKNEGMKQRMNRGASIKLF